MIARANAPDTEPTSEGNACHEQADENCKLVVHVAVNRLERKQKEDLQSHQSEACGQRAIHRGRTGAFLASGSKRCKRPRKRKDKQDRAEKEAERDVRRGAEPAQIA